MTHIAFRRHGATARFRQAPDRRTKPSDVIVGQPPSAAWRLGRRALGLGVVLLALCVSMLPAGARADDAPDATPATATTAQADDATTEATPRAPGAPTLQLPTRRANAPTGSQFYNQVLSVSAAERQRLFYIELAQGNVPDFLRTLQQVTITETINESPYTARFYVTPDYLALGTNTDFFRFPMGAEQSQWCINLLHGIHPTRKMVNAIYTAATVKLAPTTFNPANFVIDSIQVIYQHHLNVEAQRVGQPLGPIIGGIKKDVVITPQLLQRPPPPRVAIYGWHQLNGQPIQPLSLVHVNFYHDYSHGIRFVQSAMTVNGQPTTVEAVLADPVLNVLLSDEGPFTNTKYPAGPAPALPVNNGGMTLY